MEFMENALIPKLCLFLQLFSATVMLLTTIVLKMMFSTVKKIKGPKKNTISFRSLNILFIVWMFVMAIPFGFEKVVLRPFAVSVAGNTMLISILILNKECLEYVKSLVMKWKQIRDEEEKIEIRMKTRKDQWADKRRTDIDGVDHNSQMDDVIVIDMEA